MLITQDLEVTIGRPAREVFDFVTDLSQVHLWIQGAEAVPGGSNREVGSSFRIRVRGRLVVGSVSECQPPTRYVVGGLVNGVKYENAWRVIEGNGHSKLLVTDRLWLSNLAMKAGSFLISRKLRADRREQLARVQKLLMGRPQQHQEPTSSVGE